MIKIALSGTHGIGKTTVATELAHWATDRWPDLRVGAVPEMARFCPWPINDRATPEGQRWIYHAQITREIEVARRHDLVICDRAALDGLVYARRAAAVSGGQAEWDFVEPHLRLFFKDWLATYDVIWLMNPDESRPIIDDGVRSTERQFQVGVAEWFDRVLGQADGAWDEVIRPWPGMETARREIGVMVDGLGPREAA